MTDFDSISTQPAESTVWEQFIRAPLVPIAVSISAGVLVDRYLETSLTFGFLTALIGIAGWFYFRLNDRKIRFVCLLICWAGLAAVYHHHVRHFQRADDIGFHATDPPGLVRFRGTISEEPVIRKQAREDPFIPQWKVDRGSTLIETTQILTPQGWITASGRVRLTVDRAIDPQQPFALTEFKIGDVVEVTGMLHLAQGPSNPGEKDMADMIRDRQISADVHVSKTSEAIVRIERNLDFSISGTLAAVRQRACRIIDTVLAEREAKLARALLLGDGTAMEQDEWDSFVRTGVVHALAISGQHLVVLAGFFWVLFRLFGISRRNGAWFIIALLVTYAVITGLRPSALRATVMVTVACLGLIRRKPLNRANAFAFAWIMVVVLNPVDLVNTGNLLSFLSVFVLIWGAARWLAPRPMTSHERLIEEFRPPWQRIVRKIIRLIFVAYAVNVILFIANSPIIAARQNIISPVGLLIGPLLVLLTEVALIAGFGMLFIGGIDPILTKPFSWLTEWSLYGCGKLVTVADNLPGGAIDLPSPPIWFLIGFYLSGGVLIFTTSSIWRKRILAGMIVWLFMPVLVTYFTPKPDELRVTFVSVGHGGCTVLECPDGRVLVYDVGTLVGPDAVKRHVAPFLWSRGIRRIDELFLSHADSDHFNGVTELLKRFAVGRVIMTPSFAEKPTHEVAAALAGIRKAGIVPSIAVAGDRFTAGNVTVDILHPPPNGPAGAENERSLVVLVTHHNHTILLTGDLEKQGTSRVVTLPAPHVDVLMAPHHGSQAAMTTLFLNWAKPQFVVVNRGNRAGNSIQSGDTGNNVTVWDTQTMGAITVLSHRTGMTAESFRTNDHMVIRRGSR